MGRIPGARRLELGGNNRPSAAGQAIAVASGAQVVRHDEGNPLAYNKENLLNPWFIVKRP